MGTCFADIAGFTSYFYLNHADDLRAGVCVCAFHQNHWVFLFTDKSLLATFSEPSGTLWNRGMSIFPQPGEDRFAPACSKKGFYFIG